MSNSTKHYDFFVVGQGLAGTTIASRLIQAGKKVLVVDNHHQNSSSFIAAGLFNPIVFKRMNKSWLADLLIPELVEYYQNMEKQLNSGFIYFKDYNRIFPTEAERKLWMDRMEEDNFKHYIFLKEEASTNKSPLKPNEGYGTVTQTGYVDLHAFLSRFRAWLKKEDHLKEEQFDFDELVLEGEGARYKNIKTGAIIFSEGYQGLNNPYFNWLPLRHTKGEIILFKAEQLKIENTLSRGMFVLPKGNHLYLAGATYKWHTDDPKPTPEGRTELTEKLEKIIDCPYVILEQRSGIRPTVKDRRPLIGRHPVHPQLILFNGLGTKGVMLAPYFSKQLTNYLLDGTKIHPEADLRRFINDFRPS